jgi:hypothetical protein
MILDDFCLLPAWFCHVIINVRHMKSLMHISNRCALRKIANGAENLTLQSLGKDIKVKVKVMLRLTVSQSVSMSWCQVHCGTCDQIVCFVWKLLCCLCGAPSLTRGRVCLLSVSHCHQCLVHCQRFNIIYIVHVRCFKYMHNILDLCQHRLSTADNANIYATTAI